MKWTAMNADPMSTSFLAPFRNMTQISTNFELLYVGNFRIEFWGPCKKCAPKKRCEMLSSLGSAQVTETENFEN